VNRRTAIGLVLLALLIAVWLSTGDDGAPPPSSAPDESSAPLPDPEAVPPDKAGSTSESADTVDPAAAVPGIFPVLTGTVIDALTRNPIEGARVLFVLNSGSRSVSQGADTGPDGEFRFEWKPEERARAEGFVLQVSARGYEPKEIVPRAARITVELIPLDRAVLPGTILGRAVDKDHRPLSGCIGIETKTGKGKFHYHTVFADEEGRFELPGIEPGAYLVRVENSSERPEIRVPEGGTVRVEVVSTAPVPSTSAERTSAGVRKRIEELQFAELGSGFMLEAREGASREEAERVAEVFRKAQVERRWLQLRYRDFLGARPLVVTGLPKDEFVVVRAWAYSECWCVAVKNGRARFPSLTSGRWVFTLERPGQADLLWVAEVEKGKGPQTHRRGPADDD